MNVYWWWTEWWTEVLLTLKYFTVILGVCCMKNVGLVTSHVYNGNKVIHDSVAVTGRNVITLIQNFGTRWFNNCDIYNDYIGTYRVIEIKFY